MKIPTRNNSGLPLARTMLVFGAFLFLCGVARAQVTYTYTPNDSTGGVPDSWTAGTNWSPLAPVSSQDTTLDFELSGTNTVVLSNTNTNDLAIQPFVLNALILGGTGSTTPAATSSILIQGGTLNFVDSSLAVAPVLQLNATKNVGVSYNVNSAVLLGDNLTITGAGNAGFTISGVISSSAAFGLNMTASGTLVLTAANTYSGSTNIGSGATLQLGNGTTGNDGTIGASLNIGDAGTLVYDRFGASTYSGAISGVGALTVLGTGTQTLTGNNTYSGLTTLSGGALNLGSATALAGGGNITFKGGELQYSVSNTFDYSPYIVNSTSAIKIDVNGQTVTFGSALAASNTGGLTLVGSGGGTLILNAVNAYTGVTTLASGTLNLGVANALGGGGNITFTGGALQYSAGNQNDHSARIVNSTSAIKIDVNGQNINYATGLAASNTGGLTLIATGGGSLTLKGANAYTGATTVQSGTLVLGGGASLVATTTMTLGGAAGTSGTFQLGDATSAVNQTVVSLSVAAGAGATNEVVGGNTATGTFTINNTAADTYSGVIGGAGSNQNNLALVKTGASTLVLGGANTYTGSTLINAGVLNLGNASALGGGNIQFGGGTLQYGTGINTDYSGKIVGSTSAIAIDVNAQTVTYASALAASNVTGLTVSGSGGLGKLILSAANLYTGATTLTSGTLVSGNATAFGSTSNPLVLNGGVLDLQATSAYNTTVGGAVVIAADNLTSVTTATQTLGTLSIGNFTLTGSNGANVTGTATLALGAATLTGAITGNTTFAPGASTNMTLASVTSAGNSNVTFGGSTNTGTFNTVGAITIGTGTVTKNTSDVWLFNGNNTYSGSTILSSGTLIADSTTAFGSSKLSITNAAGVLDLQTVGLTNVVISANVTIDSDNPSPAAGTTRTLGTLAMGADNLTIADGPNVNIGTGTVAFGNVTATATGTFSPTTAVITLGTFTSTNTSAVFGGTQTGSNSVSSLNIGTGTVGKTTASTWVFTGTSGMTGAVSITSGSTIVSGSNVFGSNSASDGIVSFSGGYIMGTGPSAFINNPFIITTGGTLGGATGGYVVIASATENSGGTAIVDVGSSGTVAFNTWYMSAGNGGRTDTFNGGAATILINTLSDGPGGGSAQSLTFDPVGGTLIFSGTGSGSVLGLTGHATIVTIGSGATNTATTGNDTLLIQGNYTIGNGGDAVLSIKGGTPTTGQGTLSLEDGTINTLTINNVTAAQTVFTMATNSLLNMDIGNGSADEILLGSGQKASIGAGAVVLTLNGLGGQGAGPFTLISAPGGGLSTTMLSGTNTTGNFGGYDTVTTTETATALTVSLSGLVAAPTNAYWQGNDGAGGSGTWNTFTGGTNNVTNWTSAIASGTNTQQTPGSTTNVYFIADSGSNLTTTFLGASTTIATLNFTGTDATVTTGSTISISGSAIGGGTNATLTIAAGGSVTTGSGAGADTISAPLAITGNQTWTLNAAPSTPLTVSGTLSNVSGAHNLTITGTGELVLSGNNTYTGTISIDGTSIVQVGGAGALDTATPDTIDFDPGSAGTLRINGNNVTIGGLSSTSTTAVVQNGNVATTGTLTVAQSGSSTYAGVIQNGAGSAALSLTLSSGTLTLSGANTYTGVTTVNGGLLNIYGSLGSSSAVTVNSGGILSGTGGTVNGTVSVTSGGRIMPGTAANPGTLNLGNGLSIGSGGIIAFNIVDGGSGPNDFLNITGNLTLASGAILQVTGNLASAGVYTLVTTSGAAPSLTGVTEQDLGGNSLATNDPHETLSISGNSIILTVTGATQAIPSITITSPAANSRIMQNTTNVAVTGTVGNTGPVALNGTLSSSGGNFTVGNFGPTSGTFQVVSNGSTAYTGTIASVGSTLGQNTFNVTVTDGNAAPTSATTSGTVFVLQNRIVTSSVATIGAIHVNSTSGTASITLSTSGTDTQNTRVTVADGGADNTSNGFSVAGGNPSGTFNSGSATDTRTVSGGTFSGLGAQSGTITLTTTGEAGVVGTQSPVNVNVVYNASVFSGQASWASSTGGSWVNNAFWGDTNINDLNGQGAPGLAGAVSIGDTAAFNDVSGQSGISTVSLSGTTASLAGISFNSTNGYTISSGSISLQGAATPILVSTGSDTISSILTGNGLNKTGTGILILGGANIYTGSTQISNGVVDETITNALPIATVLTLGDNSNDSGQLVLGNATTVASQTVVGLQTLGTGASNSIVAGGASGTATLTFSVATGSNYIFAGAIGGVGTGQNNINIVKSGAGQETLTGALTYTGQTTVNTGVLQVSGTSMLANTTAPALSLPAPGAGLPGGVLQIFLTPGTTSINPTLGSAAGNINWLGGGFAAVSTTAGSGTLSITANGGATLIWGTNWLGGGGAAMTIGSSTSNDQVNLTNNIDLATADAFQQIIIVNGTNPGSSFLMSGSLGMQSGTGAASGLRKEGLGTLILSNTANSFSGVVDVIQGSLVAGGNSVSTGGGSVFGTGTGTSVTPTAPSAITLGDNTTTASSNPSLYLGGAFQIDRNITVTNDNASANNVNSIGGLTDNSGTFSGTISVQTLSANNNFFDVTQVATTGGHALSITGAINANGGNSVNFANAGAVIVSGSITGAGFSLIQSGTGTTTLTGINTYTGSTIVSAGTLQLGNGTSGSDGIISNSSNILDNSVTVYDYAGSNTYSGTISGTGAVTVEGSGTLIAVTTYTYDGTTSVNAGANLQLGNGTSGSDGVISNSSNLVNYGVTTYDYAGSHTYSGTITGSGTINVDGSGTLGLSGPNSSYTGNTYVYDGNLSVTNSAGSATGSGTVNVAPNLSAPATLSGNGIISGPVITAATSGANVAHIAPGVNTSGANSNFGGIGTLTLNGGLTIGNGTNLDFDLGTSSDLITVTNGLTLGSGVVLNISQAAGFSNNGTYTLLTYTGGLTGNTTGWTATGDTGDNAVFNSGGGVVTVTFTPNNNSTGAITPSPISLGSVLVGFTPASVSGTLTNGGSIGSGTFTTVATGSASVAPGSATLAPSATQVLTVGAANAIGGPSGNNVVIGTVYATNSANVSGSAPAVNVTANIYQVASLTTGTINNGSSATLDLTNAASTDGGQRAGVTINGYSTTNSNFVVTTDNGGVVGTANGSNVTQDVGTVSVATNLLSGTYTYAGTITGTAQYTDSALQSQGGGSLVNPQWSGVSISGTVNASAPYGQTNTAFIASGSSFAGYGLTSSQGDTTTATLLNGTASANTNLNMSFSAHGSLGGGETSSPSPGQSSDTLTLTGLHATGGTGPDGGSTITDPFVLQLSVTTNPNVAAGMYYLGWYDVNAPGGASWVNAIAGNSNANLPNDYVGSGAFAGTYAQYLTANSLTMASPLSGELGAYGYDSTTGVAWAVLDYDSDIEVIPEPGTYAMIFSGFGMLLGFRKLRRRRSKGI